MGMFTSNNNLTFSPPIFMNQNNQFGGSFGGGNNQSFNFGINTPINIGPNARQVLPNFGNMQQAPNFTSVTPQTFTNPNFFFPPQPPQQPQFPASFQQQAPMMGGSIPPAFQRAPGMGNRNGLQQGASRPPFFFVPVFIPYPPSVENPPQQQEAPKPPVQEPAPPQPAPQPDYPRHRRPGSEFFAPFRGLMLGLLGGLLSALGNFNQPPAPAQPAEQPPAQPQPAYQTAPPPPAPPADNTGYDNPDNPDNPDYDFNTPDYDNTGY